MTTLAGALTHDVSFGPTVEIVLFALGVAMTLGVLGVVVFLVRAMLREDRERARGDRGGKGGA